MKPVPACSAVAALLAACVSVPVPAVVEPPLAGTRATASPVARATFSPITVASPGLVRPLMHPYAGSSDGFENGAPGAFNYPEALAFDSSGKLYVTEPRHLRFVGTDLDIGTLAGWTEDTLVDGPLAEARFSSEITGAAVDPADHLYVSDAGHHAVRKVSGNQVSTLSTDFVEPAGLVVESSGSLLVADAGSHSIKRLTQAGAVSTFASGALQKPWGLVLDQDGTLYVSDPGRNRICAVDSSGAITDIAGAGDAGFADGTAAQARFDYPTGMAGDGNFLYIADTGNNRIRMLSKAGDVATVAGDGGTTPGAEPTSGWYASLAALDRPKGLAVRDHNLYVADTGRHVIREITF